MKKAASVSYYILQIVCWSVFALMHVVFSAINLPLNSLAVYNGLFIGAAGFLTSHLLRSVYRRPVFNLKKPKTLILRTFICILLATALWETLIIWTHIVFFEFYTLASMSRSATVFWYYYYFVVLTLWSLLYFVIKIVAQRRREAIEKLELEIALRDAQLQNLKWQMNPHFLFNSLNSVRALISEDADRAKKMITKMASLLRYALNSPEHNTVELAGELECVRTYLELEQVRFEDRLRFSIDAEPACLKLPMLPMCLQTLVENAVKHGIARLPSGGWIHLSVRATEMGMRMEIENTGALVEPVSHGTGLKNTRERIALVFGKRSSLSLSRKDDNTVLTTLELEIPS